MEWRRERWGEPTKTANRGWNGPFYGLVSRIAPVQAEKQGAKPDRLLVLEGAEKSLAEGRKLPSGATLGSPVDLRRLAVRQLGAGAAKAYGLG
jgi:hypothetical protein